MPATFTIDGAPVSLFKGKSLACEVLSTQRRFLAGGLPLVALCFVVRTPWSGLELPRVLAAPVTFPVVARFAGGFGCAAFIEAALGGFLFLEEEAVPSL